MNCQDGIEIEKPDLLVIACCTEKEEGVYLHLDFHGTILASVIFMTNASFDPGLR